MFQNCSTTLKFDLEHETWIFLGSHSLAFRSVTLCQIVEFPVQRLFILICTISLSNGKRLVFRVSFKPRVWSGCRQEGEFPLRLPISGGSSLYLFSVLGRADAERSTAAPFLPSPRDGRFRRADAAVVRDETLDWSRWPEWMFNSELLISITGANWCLALTFVISSWTRSAGRNRETDWIALLNQLTRRLNEFRLKRCCWELY